VLLADGVGVGVTDNPGVGVGVTRDRLSISMQDASSPHIVPAHNGKLLGIIVIVPVAILYFLDGVEFSVIYRSYTPLVHCIADVLTLFKLNVILLSFTNNVQPLVIKDVDEFTLAKPSAKPDPSNGFIRNVTQYPVKSTGSSFISRY
jgi:hypothetical protein